MELAKKPLEADVPTPDTERISGIQESEPEMVDFHRVTLIETEAQAEARRARNQRIAKEARFISKRITGIVEGHWMNGAKEALDYSHDLEVLNEGEVVERVKLGEGANGTRLLEIEYGHELVIAFEKSESAEKAQLINPANGELITAHTRFEMQPDKTLVKNIEFTPSARYQDSDINKNARAFYESRELYEDIYVGSQANFYGIDRDKLPAVKSEYGLRMVEVGRSVVREYICASIDAITGLHVVPVTVLKTDGEELYSRQKGLQQMVELALPESQKGTDALITALLKRQDHPGKKDLMRLAVLHDLVEHSDGHEGNVMMDEDDKGGELQVRGIDFGYSFPYHFLDAKGEVTSRDTIMSAAIQLVELDPGLKLDDEALQSLRDVYNSISDFLKYQEMKENPDISAKERARLEALPEEVKTGLVAKLLSKLITMAYEREGEPEVTAAIAKKEAKLFMDRLANIIKTGRPRLPNRGLKEGRFSRLPGLTERVNKVIKDLQRGTMFDLDEPLSDEEWAKKHVKPGHK